MLTRKIMFLRQIQIGPVTNAANSRSRWQKSCSTTSNRQRAGLASVHLNPAMNVIRGGPLFVSRFRLWAETISGILSACMRTDLRYIVRMVAHNRDLREGPTPNRAFSIFRADSVTSYLQSCTSAKPPCDSAEDFRRLNCKLGRALRHARSLAAIKQSFATKENGIAGLHQNIF